MTTQMEMLERANALNVSALEAIKATIKRDLWPHLDFQYPEITFAIIRAGETIAAERRAREAAEARAAGLAERLEMATNDQETYDYRRGYEAGIEAAVEVCESRAVMDDTDSDECRECARAIRALTTQPPAKDTK